MRKSKWREIVVAFVFLQCYLNHLLKNHSAYNPCFTLAINTCSRNSVSSFLVQALLCNSLRLQLKPRVLSPIKSSSSPHQWILPNHRTLSLIPWAEFTLGIFAMYLWIVEGPQKLLSFTDLWESSWVSCVALTRYPCMRSPVLYPAKSGFSKIVVLKKHSRKLKNRRWFNIYIIKGGSMHTG